MIESWQLGRKTWRKGIYRKQPIPPSPSPRIVMGFSKLFKRSNGLKLNSRSATYSVTVPPKVSDFSSIAPSAHTLTVSQLIEDLGTSQADGLSKNEAARRLESCGENVLKGEDGVSALRVLFGQFGEADNLIFGSLKLMSYPNSKCIDSRTSRGPGAEFWRAGFR